MKIAYYQGDAFTERTFGGNPTGVCFAGVVNKKIFAIIPDEEFL